MPICSTVTIDWRAGCGRTASPVRWEGNRNPMRFPYLNPLPVVVTTGKEVAATKRPGGPTHESYWAGRARVCRPSGPFAFLCDRNRGLRPRQRMCQPSRLQGGKCWNCCQWSEARSAGRSSAYGGNPRLKSGERHQSAEYALKKDV